MSNNEIEKFEFVGSCGSLPIKSEDNAARKLAMILEVKCNGSGPTKAAKKFGYTKQRYFQILNDYEKGGIKALIDKKVGPKRNYVRTEVIENQIIRYRFLDPEASVAVIAQKLNQDGYKISKRSVERTITKYGIQKKTPSVKSRQRDKNSGYVSY